MTGNKSTPNFWVCVHKGKNVTFINSSMDCHQRLMHLKSPHACSLFSLKLYIVHSRSTVLTLNASSSVGGSLAKLRPSPNTYMYASMTWYNNLCPATERSLPSNETIKNTFKDTFKYLCLLSVQGNTRNGRHSGPTAPKLSNVLFLHASQF